MEDEYYTEIKNKVRDMVISGIDNQEILLYYKDDIDNRKITKKAIYKYIADAKNSYISVVLNRYIKEKKIPEKSLFVLDFLLKWANVFQKETAEIFTNERIKRKIPALEHYLKSLDRVYNMLDRILPAEEKIAQIVEKEIMPIRKANEDDNENRD